MGPRSEYRGYRISPLFHDWDGQSLQWVHGPRTVVIGNRDARMIQPLRASMGPRSEDRGYRTRSRRKRTGRWRFNGSTVRGPWLSVEPARFHAGDTAASMGPRSEDRGYRSRKWQSRTE